ncbi:cytochrome P450 [Elsinoe ampelina]|uniref:Cytochrome P450 n=1 Tax=Elsinoe ampelina TaxID=302913 RepID=A0A6A6G6W7_9PEZI|nr:cytochrome P450 [Elsinoe ampelina]
MLSDPAKQGSRNSIISQLVLNSDSHLSGSKSAGLTETEVFGNLFVFTAAGFDTTANALQFAIVLLAIHSDLQAWLYEEFLSIIRPYENNTEASDDIEYAAIYPRAIRCQAFLMEVLRVHPPVVHSMRINKSGKTQMIKTSKHTIHVPINTTIYTDSNSVQTDPKVWRGLNLPNFNGQTGVDVIETPEDVVERTQDEYRFRPGRWVMDDNTLFKPPPGSFLPFAAGPRICPGQKMAQVEFVGVIMTLLRRFKIVPNSRHGETEMETKNRMQSILDDVRSELTIVMQRMNELDLRWEQRV